MPERIKQRMINYTRQNDNTHYYRNHPSQLIVLQGQERHSTCLLMLLMVIYFIVLISHLIAKDLFSASIFFFLKVYNLAHYTEGSC